MSCWHPFSSSSGTTLTVAGMLSMNCTSVAVMAPTPSDTPPSKCLENHGRTAEQGQFSLSLTLWNSSRVHWTPSALEEYSELRETLSGRTANLFICNYHSPDHDSDCSQRPNIRIMPRVPHEEWCRAKYHSISIFC